jgi:hypothetical protein
MFSNIFNNSEYIGNCKPNIFIVNPDRLKAYANNILSIV